MDNTGGVAVTAPPRKSTKELGFAIHKNKPKAKAKSTPHAFGIGCKVTRLAASPPAKPNPSPAANQATPQPSAPTQPGQTTPNHTRTVSRCTPQEARPKKEQGQRHGQAARAPQTTQRPKKKHSTPHQKRQTALGFFPRAGQKARASQGRGKPTRAPLLFARLARVFCLALCGVFFWWGVLCVLSFFGRRVGFGVRASAAFLSVPLAFPALSGSCPCFACWGARVSGLCARVGFRWFGLPAVSVPACLSGCCFKFLGFAAQKKGVPSAP